MKGTVVTQERLLCVKALSKTLLLTFSLIVASLCFDFIASIICSEIWRIILETIKYAALMYSLICQFDILMSFIVIITKSKEDDKPE